MSYFQETVWVGRGLRIEICTQRDIIHLEMWVRTNRGRAVGQFASSHLARWRRVLENSQKCKLASLQFPAMDPDFERSHSEVKKKKK